MSFDLNLYIFFSLFFLFVMTEIYEIVLVIITKIRTWKNNNIDF